MNGLWKKRVPAFLLTLVMIVSLMPAALANELSQTEGEEPPPTVCQHENAIWREKTPATCGTAGEEENYCPDCTTILGTREIPATGKHNYINAKETSDKQHQVECSVCHATTTENHNWNTPKYTDETYHTEVCKDCLATRTVKHTHSSTDKGTTTASCLAAGKTTYTCSDCGEKYSEDTPALGHTQPNAAGKCDRCGEVLVTGISVSFNTNGGSTISSQIVPAGQTLPTPISNPSKGNYYTFMGWQENTAGSLYTGQTLKALPMLTV